MKKRSNIYLIIFDFDGTLAETKQLYLSTIHSVLVHHGYSVPSSEINKNLGVKLKPLLQAVGVKEKEVIPIGEEINKEVIKHADVLKACMNISAVRSLKKKYYLALVSNSLLEFIRPLVRKNRLHFDVTLGGRNFTTKPQAFSTLCKQFRILPSQAVYVADRHEDVVLARTAGCKMIAVSNQCSWSSYRELQKEKPDAIVKSLADIKRAVQSLQ